MGTYLNSHLDCSPGFSCLRLRAFAYLPNDRFEEDLILNGRDLIKHTKMDAKTSSVGFRSVVVLLGEPNESGVSLDFVFLSKIRVLSGIDLAKLDVRSISFQLLSSLGKLGSQSLAVSAPRSVEFNKSVVLFFQPRIEVVSSENINSFILGDFGVGAEGKKDDREEGEGCVHLQANNKIPH